MKMLKPVYESWPEFLASIKPKVRVSEFKARFEMYKPYEGTYIYLVGQKLRCISEEWIEIVW